MVIAEYFVDMSRRDAETVRAVGTVKEVLPNALFRVELTSGESVLTHVGGQLRLYSVRILPGDEVTVELSPYDTGHGRLIRSGGPDAL